MASENNKRMIQARQQKNLYNPVSNLFRKLTRLFSGPIVMYRQQTQKTLRNKQLNKYASKFYDTSGAAFKKSEFNPFDNLNLSRMVNHQRALRYSEFSTMEFSPDISSCLDVYAEECTVYSPLQPIINIKCSNEEIKEVLNNLIYKTLNFEFNAFSWMRSLCKYGDFFLYLDIDEERGVKNVIGLPTEEIERIEGEDKDNPNYIQFQWNTRGLTFENWQLAHFRILGNDRFAPYGSCLKEDTRIITENGVKEIKDITISDKIYSFDLEKQSKILTNVLDVVNSGEKECFRLSTKHNFIEASKEHKILCFDKEKGFYYKNTLEFKIGDLLVLDKKYNNLEKEIKIDKSLPNEKKDCISWKNIDSIPEYVNEEFAKLLGFLLGDGWLAPNRVEFALGVEKGLNEYYINLLRKFSGTNVFLKKRGKLINLEYNAAVCNSKMLNYIIARMGFIQGCHKKRIPYWVYEAKKNIKEAFLQGIYDADGFENTDKWNCTRFSFQLSNEQLVKDLKILIQSLGYKTGKICFRKERGIRFVKSLDRYINTKESFCLNYYKSENIQTKCNDNPYRNSDDYILEPIISIESIGKYKTYDIYVENDNHNFIANGIVVHNSVLDGARRIFRQLCLIEDAMMSYRVVRSAERKVFYIDVGNIAPTDVEAHMQKIMTQMKRSQVVDADSSQVDLRYRGTSVDEDYFVPTRPGSQTKIESLPGGQYTGDIDDVKYLRDKLFAALKVPMSYVSRGDGASDDKQSLASKDVRFARTIQRLQRSLTSELEKIAIIHLYILGFRGEDLLSFNLSLNNPSKITELQELEHWRTKFDVAKAATEGFFSRRWIAEHLFNMSDEEVQRNQREIFYDREMDKSWEAIATPEEGEMGGDLGSDFSDTSSDESASSDETDSNEEDDILLAKPEEGGGTLPPVGEQSMVPTDKTSYISPNAKGKVYTPVKSDRRNMGARKRHMQSMYSSEKSSNARRNLYPGTSNMFGLSNGIMENKDPSNSNYLLEQQEEQLLKDNKDIKLLIESLSQRAKKNESDS